MLTLSDVLLGAVPGVAWLLWIHRRDDHEPEPAHLVIAVFLLGALAALLQVWLRPRIEAPFLGDGLSLWSHVMDAFVVTALSEELLKFLAFALGALWLAEWDEPLDGIVYGAAAGLGFASLENAYFLAATGEMQVVLWRGFTSTLAHVAFSAGAGFFIGLVRLGRMRAASGCLLALGYAVLLHGIYDLVLARGAHAAAALLGVLPVLLIALALKMRWARHRSAAFHPRAMASAHDDRAR